MKKVFEINFEKGSSPEEHEIQTALFLRAMGKRVTFLAPTNRPNTKTPDILMDNKKWEIKSPRNAGSRTIEHAVRAAAKQSENIIVDLRRFKQSTQKGVAQIKHHSLRRTNIKKLLVITHNGELLDIK